ncbi:fimbrial protein [Providencia manganoxydans]|uniref:fimbrial protein n=1 Tax=Providencia manganoxydans TaxID=2923283 RepID=UPI0034E578E1
MKKNIIASLIAATSIFAINNALAADGNIDFTGEIIDQACELASGSDALTVNLGKVSKTAFKAPGDTAAATKFTIKLTNCPATVSNASVKFDAETYLGDDSVIALKTDPNEAKGVGIQITDDVNAVIPLFTASKQYTLQSGTGVVNNLDFRARYIAKDADVKPGIANGTATFTVNYN